MIDLDGEKMTLARAARRLIAAGDSDAAIRAKIGDQAPPDTISIALGGARRAAGVGAEPGGKWRQEREDELRRLFFDGLSFAAIAERMGGGLTRNAVLGKANRLGLVRNKSSARAPARVAPKVAAVARAGAPSRVAPKAAPTRVTQPPRPVVAPRPETVAAAVGELEPKVAALLGLREGQCKFPYGAARYSFCGRPAEAGKPYCAHHALIAFSPDCRAPSEGRKGEPRERVIDCVEAFGERR